MEYNSSLSARIRRRNKQGFNGIGTGLGFNPKNKTYGDYTDSTQNHKDVDRKQDIAHKNKVGYRAQTSITKDGLVVGLAKGNYRCMNKKYADGHQKLK